MCGRFTQAADLKSLLKRFGLRETGLDLPPRYNLAPSQSASVVVGKALPELKLMRWGLVPRWAKDPAIGTKMINARGETLAERPAFRTAFALRRCLIPADGFYEWRKEGKAKVPLRIVLKSREPFGLAGLWESWTGPDGKALESFTIVTTEANPLLKAVHDRMPVILRREDEARWLDPEVKDAAKVAPLLKPYPEEEMEFYPVSPAVNSPKNDAPELILPV